MKWWLIALIPLSAILATEVYNCHWNLDGKYACDLISEKEPEELPINETLDEPDIIDVNQQDSFVGLKVACWDNFKACDKGF